MAEASGAAGRAPLRGLGAAAGAVLDLFWPPGCEACGQGLEPGRRGPLCEDCRRELPLVLSRACPRCAMPLGPFEETHGGCYCASCGDYNLVFHRAATAGLHEGPLAALVRRYKYSPRGGGAYLAGYLVELLLARLRLPECPVATGDVDLLCPAPMHWARRLERGFDHGAELARLLARRLGLKLEMGNLVKPRATPPQAGLARAARLSNLDGAFAVRRPERFRDRVVLLLDDVLSTGATLEQCARALRAAGAREVRVAAVARAVGGGRRSPFPSLAAAAPATAPAEPAASPEGRKASSGR